MLCDHLDGWDMDGGRETQKRGDMEIYVYVQLIHFVIKQKLRHHCKAIMFQDRCLKKKSITKTQTNIHGAIYIMPVIISQDA